MERLLLKPSEVAEALGVGRTTAYELIRTGRLPTIRVGRSVRVPRAELERWLTDQTTGVASKRGGA